MRYDEEAEYLVLSAAGKARKLGHSFVGSVHLLLSLSEQNSEAGRLLRQFGAEPELITDLLCAGCGMGTRDLPVAQGMTPALHRILRGAASEAVLSGRKRIGPWHLLLSLLRRDDSEAARLLDMTVADRELLFSLTVEIMYQETSSKRKKEGFVTKLLEQFGEDLVAKASSMDPVIGREREIDMVIGILSRKNKNNPALIGEPGVGKTAIAEGLAQRMASGLVPPQLKDKRLFSLNMANLVAGTKYRGEFEERLRDVLAEIRRSGDVILFMDEMHTMIGAGAAEGAIDAANIFKPALGRGELQMLGATTLNEYRKYVEKDSALERRFRPVMVQEPDAATTESILKALKPGLERHHHIRISEEAISQAVSLSVRYLPEQFLPDKAIDLLDEGAAHARMAEMGNGMSNAARLDLENALHQAVRESRFEKAAELRDRMQRMTVTPDGKRPRTVTGADIAWAVSARTGIPTGKLTASRREQLLHLEKALSESVMGQPQAVASTADAIRRGFSGIRDENRPAVSLLFVGKTGVGKTEMCRALAEELYGSRKSMIRLDMTEYMEKQSVSRLIGAPPGYVGYEEGGKLTEAVRRRPYCLVLFDEIEKAHRDVLGILLQIMEEGTLTDSNGRSVSFKNAVVVMTSNAGSEKRGDGLGFLPGEDPAAESLREYFTPEFLGRLDGIVHFGLLSPEAMGKIAAKYLDQLGGRLQRMGMRFFYTEEAVRRLAEKGKGADGARGIRKVVQEKVEGPLSLMLLEERRKITRVSLGEAGGKLCLECL